MTDMDDFIRYAAQRQREVMEKIFQDMPVGTILCVHQAQIEGDEFDMRVVARGHILQKGAMCDEQVIKTQYGPKPEDLDARSG